MLHQYYATSTATLVHYQVDAHTCSQPPHPDVSAFHHTLLEQPTPQHITPPDRPAAPAAASSCTARTMLLSLVLRRVPEFSCTKNMQYGMPVQAVY